MRRDGVGPGADIASGGSSAASGSRAQASCSAGSSLSISVTKGEATGSPAAALASSPPSLAA